MNTIPRVVLRLASVLILASTPALTFAAEENLFDEYRQMMADDNPAQLAEMQGEEYWKTAGGPKKQTLQGCDLGLGPGKTQGAYAVLPRFFADAGRVMDLETRLIWCMTTIQGRDPAELSGKAFSKQGQPTTDLEGLTTWIAGQSRDRVLAVPVDQPQVRAAFEEGKRLFFYRAGPYDFSCASCHSQSGKRIRLTSLPNLTTHDGAVSAYTTWPTYRVSQGAARTMQWRMVDCARQQRLPELIVGSPVTVSLLTYLAASANGGKMAAPGLKR
ncbi:MAG: SoxA protein [Panacagrimonas sp.]|jgi:sulfur-oxidizing protein SoxA|nr:sulfur oxidation c-type cytochrome SoxA [Panacagrimonas sp.]MCC2658675.1 SoxA protein [Panacagrimonas sp.]